MSKLIRNYMRDAIIKVLAAHGLSVEFEKSSEFHARVVCDGFMPLVIEKHTKTVSITHYYEQNGDLVPDPDMEFYLTEFGWVPAAIQFCTGNYRRATEYNNEGKLMANKKELRDQEAFAKMWARNILAQGFADSQRSSIEKSSSE